MKNNFESPANLPGIYSTALRWVLGWTYFSAFWRRLILDNKLIPEEAGYIGEKFNHFLPNAIGIKPLIEHLVLNPELLQTSMVIFTIVEAIIGLFLILGLFTRLMSIGVILLAAGILLGSGWLGTTCLDEWQIGVLGIAGGFTILLSGGGKYALDNLLSRTTFYVSNGWVQLLTSAPLAVRKMRTVVLIASILIFGLTLYTNQVFHGGVYGKLHNKSVKPKVEISEITFDRDTLTFQVFRSEGADVYGSFLIGIQILDQQQQVVKTFSQTELANFPQGDIHNYYVAKVKPGKHSLILPLGARADLSVSLQDLRIEKGYSIKLIDISGIEWTGDIRI